MANWYAALFSRAPSKVCRAKCQPWNPPSPWNTTKKNPSQFAFERQPLLHLMRFVVMSKFYLTAPAAAWKYGVSTLTCPINVCIHVWLFGNESLIVPICFRPGLDVSSNLAPTYPDLAGSTRVGGQEGREKYFNSVLSITHLAKDERHRRKSHWLSITAVIKSLTRMKNKSVALVERGTIIKAFRGPAKVENAMWR